MNPRKKDSKKWSSIPAELATQIKTVFEQNFAAHLSEKTIKVQGRIYPDEVVLRVGIHNKGELRHNNFEVSIDYDHGKQNIIQKVHLAVDSIASFMLEFFENEDADLPYLWQEYPFEKEKIWFQFSTENPDLEKEANKLLGLDEDSLIVEDEAVDPDLIGSEVEEDGDADETDEDSEEIDLKKPSLFKKSKKKKDDLH